MFQPAEEVDVGALEMMEEASLQNLIKGSGIIFGIHVLPTLQAGVAALNEGALMGSQNEFKVEYDQD